MQAYWRKDKRYVDKKLREKRKKMKQNFELTELAGTADKKIILSKFVKLNWIFNLYTITESNKGTLPTYWRKNLPERCNEALLKKTGVTSNEKIYTRTFTFLLKQKVFDHHF